MKMFKKKYEKKKIQKMIYTAVFAVLIGWFVYRFIMVALESRMSVFNPARDANTNGVLVQTMVANRIDGEIKIPVAVNNNRAYVSGKQKAKLRVGQNLGDGVITHISSDLDLDTGMYVVKTRGVKNGINYAVAKYNCFFVPVYAVRNGALMIYDNGMVVEKLVVITASDSENTCISEGLDSGDIVVLSRVDVGQKVKIK